MLKNRLISSKRVCCLVCLLCLALMALPVNGVNTAHAAVGPYDAVITDAYSRALSQSGRTSFNGWCGLYVRLLLDVMNIGHVPGGVLGNGNQVYGNLTADATTSYDYKQVKYPGNNCLYDIVNTYGNNATNIVISWSYQSGHSYSDPGAGHVVFINGIIDNVVYYSESYTASGIREGSPRKRPLNEFMSAYNSTYGNAIGAVIFTKDDPAPATTEINETYQVRSSVDVGLNIRPQPSASTTNGKLYYPTTIHVTKRTNYQSGGYYWMYGEASDGKSGWIAYNLDWIEPYDDTPRGSEMSTGYGQPIADGDYLIVNAGDQSYFLDIDGIEVPASNGANVLLCGPLTSDFPPEYDLWTVTYVGNGFYSIKQYNANVSLDVQDADTRQGANIMAYESHSGSNQQWAISSHPYGGYRIQAKVSGYSLDVTDGTMANATNIQQYPNNDTSAQAWVFIPYDKASPAVSNITVSDVSPTGYTVTCTVSDNVGVSRVAFPTMASGETEFIWKDGTISGNTASFRVNTSEHGDRYGNYRTEIYAYDAAENHNEFDDSIIVSVDVPSPTVSVTGVTLSSSSMTLMEKQSGVLTAAVLPANATDKAVTWTSSDTSVATVSNGTVTAQAMGVATITAKTNDGGKTASCVVIVRDAKPLKLPANLKTIGDEAFMDAAAREIIVPDGVKRIGARAFALCTKLKLIWMPDSVTEIADNAFAGDQNFWIIADHVNTATRYAEAKGIHWATLDGSR